MTFTAEHEIYFNDLDTLLYQARALVNLLALAGNGHIVSQCVADPEAVLGGAWLANDLLARAQQVIAAEAEARRNAGDVQNG